MDIFDTGNSKSNTRSCMINTNCSVDRYISYTLESIFQCRYTCFLLTHNLASKKYNNLHYLCILDIMSYKVDNYQLQQNSTFRHNLNIRQGISDKLNKVFHSKNYLLYDYFFFTVEILHVVYSRKYPDKHEEHSDIEGPVHFFKLIQEFYQTCNMTIRKNTLIIGNK